MNKRRDALKAMMAPIITQPSSEDRQTRTPVKSGSLKAMGLSLQSLSQEADEARVLREQLAGATHVVELDPALHSTHPLFATGWMTQRLRSLRLSRPVLPNTDNKSRFS